MATVRALKMLHKICQPRPEFNSEIPYAKYRVCNEEDRRRQVANERVHPSLAPKMHPNFGRREVLQQLKQTAKCVIGVELLQFKGKPNKIREDLRKDSTTNIHVASGAIGHCPLY